VDAEFGAVAGDPEVGVLDVDGDDVTGVSAANPQDLPGDHDLPVDRDLALDADRPGDRCRELGSGQPGTAEAGALIGRDRCGKSFDQAAVVDDVHQVPIEAQRDFAAVQVRTRLTGSQPPTPR
jgi:hypothetical protein